MNEKEKVDIEILKKDILHQIEEQIEESANIKRRFWYWKMSHPIQYHKWLRTPEGQKYKFHKLLKKYTMGL